MKVRVELGGALSDDWDGDLVVLEDTPGGALRVTVEDQHGNVQMVKLYPRGYWTGAHWLEPPDQEMRERISRAHALPQPLIFRHGLPSGPRPPPAHLP